MNARVEREVARLDHQKAEMLRRVRAWPSEWLMYRSSPVEWSAVQVLEHLAKTELSVVRSCETNWKSREHTVSRIEGLRAAALVAIMHLPVRVSAPPAVSRILPGEPLSLDAVMDLWAVHRLSLAAFLRSIGTGDGRVGLIFHPAAGWINLWTTLRFISAHIRHHEYQLQRIRRAASAHTF
jgi:hypothetical protein